MQVPAVEQAVQVEQNFNIQAVQGLVAESVKKITAEMLKALMNGLMAKLDFKRLAERHTVKTHRDDFLKSERIVQVVHSKLYLATNEHIQKNSLQLSMTLAGINIQTEDNDAAGMFLGSFVLPEAKSLIEKLKVEQPWALEKFEIWA